MSKIYWKCEISTWERHNVARFASYGINTPILKNLEKARNILLVGNLFNLFRCSPFPRLWPWLLTKSILFLECHTHLWRTAYVYMETELICIAWDIRVADISSRWLAIDVSEISPPSLLATEPGSPALLDQYKASVIDTAGSQVPVPVPVPVSVLVLAPTRARTVVRISSAKIRFVQIALNRSGVVQRYCLRADDWFIRYSSAHYVRSQGQ